MVKIDRVAVQQLKQDYNKELAKAEDENCIVEKAIDDDTKYTYDGNLLTVENWTDINNNGEKDPEEWGVEYFTDKYTLGERSDVENITIIDGANVIGDVIGSNIYAKNTKGIISGKDLLLEASEGSDIDLRGRGETEVLADGKDTKVVMRDHNPDDTNYAPIKSELFAKVVNGAKVIQAAYNAETVNKGVVEGGGLLDQQGAHNEGIAKGPESIVWQQGSKEQKSMYNKAQAEEGANIVQENDTDKSKSFANAIDSQVLFNNADGNYFVTLKGRSSYEQLGGDNADVERINSNSSRNRTNNPSDRGNYNYNPYDFNFGYDDSSLYDPFMPGSNYNSYGNNYGNNSYMNDLMYDTYLYEGLNTPFMGNYGYNPYDMGYGGYGYNNPMTMPIMIVDMATTIMRFLSMF